MHWRFVLAVTITAARGVSAQATQPQAATAEVMSAAAIARHIAVIADDSMLGRDTPSRGLEQTAQYVAAQFQALGLEPVEIGGNWLRRYSLPGHSLLANEQSQLLFVSKVKRGNRTVVDESGWPIMHRSVNTFDATAVFAVDTVLDQQAPGARGGGQGSVSLGELTYVGPAVVAVAGPQTVESMRRANLRDRVVVYVPPTSGDSTSQQVVEFLRASNHVIIIADEDSAAFAHRRRTAQAHPPAVFDWYWPEAEHFRRWAVYVWAPAIQRILLTAGLDLAEARASQTPIVRELAAVAMLSATASDSVARTNAPNVIGLLRGREPWQAVVLTAHMDHTGLRRGHADSIANGADDNASGVAGLLELAQAFARSGVQPRRSIVFAAVSGGAKTFWGSNALLGKWPLGAGRIIMNLNLDMIGRAARDSIRIDGLQDVELPVRPAWLAAQHPELRLTVVDGGNVVAPVSDHFAFVRRGIPSLYVHGGSHGEPGGEPGADADDVPAAVDAEQETRLLRFVALLTREIVEAPRTPHWTSEGLRQRALVVGD